MSNSKAKGSNFERYMCKVLTEWITGKKSPVIFWRVGSSGACATLSKSNSMVGDVVAVDEKGLFFTNTFTVELKAVKSMNLLELFSSNCRFWKWWEQVERDSKRVNNIPLLIFKINNRGIFVSIKTTDLEKFKEECDNFLFDRFIFNDYLICKLEDFLSYLDKWKVKNV